MSENTQVVDNVEPEVEVEGTEPEPTDTEATDEVTDTVTDEGDEDGDESEDEVEVDNLEIHQGLTESLANGQNALQDIADFMDAVKEHKVWEDPRVVKDDGKPFVSLGSYLRYQLKGYPLVDKALTNKVIDLLLEEGVSLRAIAEITGKSKSAISNRKNKDRQRSPRVPDGSDAAGEQSESEGGDVDESAPRKDVDGQGSTPAEEATKLASQVVNALTTAGNRVDEFSVADIDRILAAMDDNRGIFEAMREIKAQNEAVDDAA